MVTLNKHFVPKNLSDKIALSFTQFLRFLADTFFKKRYGHRAVNHSFASILDGRKINDQNKDYKISNHNNKKTINE